MGKVDYQTYMASKAWQRRRASYFAEGWPKCCVACGAGSNITLHHMTYVRLGNEASRDLIAICRECHERLHDKASNAGKGGVRAFQQQLVLIFGLSEAEAADRMRRWTSRQRIGKKTRRRLKAQAKESRIAKRKVDIARMLEARAKNGYAADGSRLPTD